MDDLKSGSHYPDDPGGQRDPDVVYPSAVTAAAGGGKSLPPPPTADDDEEEDDAGDGMLRMSFMGHLEELRSRILKALGGLISAFLVCMFFSSELWRFVSAPATEALTSLGFTPKLVQITPMETFTVVWVKLPLVAAIFLAAPWIVLQVWGFVAPGLYKKERRMATPFILVTAGLFIAGGAFAYFVAFRFGLTFLLGIGRDINIQPMVSVTEYFDLFVNVVLGIAIVFELPVVIFFLTLLRIASPSFLLQHSRYAILAIVVLAAVITPTPDFFNLTLFAVPMVLLYFLGVFASYILVMRRENRKFPWMDFLKWVGTIVALIIGGVAIAIYQYGYHLTWFWPFLIK